ncbi:MAG: helix-turn-helix domain containing protein [Lachnospiraceae bacterium]|nr:helix-turn-helix domain containing protein [Lachnospiraceae bacterium]
MDDRKEIQNNIDNRIRKSITAKKLKKDPTTISKEIKLHRSFKPRNKFNSKCICSKIKSCKKPRKYCSEHCSNYVELRCNDRDKFIGSCNHCSYLNSCKLDHYFYNATNANEEYLFHLSDARSGINLSNARLTTIASTIAPLLKKGQSIYQILTNHPDINLSPKSLYNYIECGAFKKFGIDNFSLRRQVSMKPRKKLKIRKEPINYAYHTYIDYLEFVANNPSIPTTEMDTVYNQPEGPYIQTFSFQNTGLMIGFLHAEKTSNSMASTLDYLESTLNNDYQKLFSLILTDRGSEFEKINLFERNMETNIFRTNIFYCDPQMPSQKPHVEVNHNYVRDIIPNKRVLKKVTQNDIQLMFSHINSSPRKVLGGKTPYEVFSFFYSEDILNKLGIIKIEPDDVTLQPYLLKIE